LNKAEFFAEKGNLIVNTFWPGDFPDAIYDYGNATVI